MTEDEKILFFTFIGYWIALTFLTYKCDKKIKIVVANIIIHIAYSSYFLYGLYYKSQGGTALAWFVYLLFIIWTHTLINLGQVAYRILKSKKK